MTNGLFPKSRVEVLCEKLLEAFANDLQDLHEEKEEKQM